VRPGLAGAEQPVDLIRCGVVSRDEAVVSAVKYTFESAIAMPCGRRNGPRSTRRDSFRDARSITEIVLPGVCAP
jgi:hypothetical protein